MTLADFTATDITGRERALSEFLGKTVLVVNVALHRDPLDPRNFNESALADPAIRDLCKRTTMGVLPEGTNAHRDSDVREALRPVLVMADRLGVTVVFIRHLNKMAGADPLARGTGSVSFGAVARVVLNNLYKHTELQTNFRSEERRVGKEGRSRGSPYH